MHRSRLGELYFAPTRLGYRYRQLSFYFQCMFYFFFLKTINDFKVNFQLCKLEKYDEKKQILFHNSKFPVQETTPSSAVKRSRLSGESSVSFALDFDDSNACDGTGLSESILSPLVNSFQSTSARTPRQVHNFNRFFSLDMVYIYQKSYTRLPMIF